MPKLSEDAAISRGLTWCYHDELCADPSGLRGSRAFLEGARMVVSERLEVTAARVFSKSIDGPQYHVRLGLALVHRNARFGRKV